MKDLKFKPVMLEDKEAIEFYLSKYSDFCLSAFTFSSLFAWQRGYHYQWSILSDTLFLKFTSLEDKNEHFLQPIGEFSGDLQSRFIQYAQSLNYRLGIYGVSRMFIVKHPKFISYFEQTEHRDMDNYIYLAEDLVLLKGRKYQAKRNLLKQFEKNFTWSSEAIEQKNIPDCFLLLKMVYGLNPVDVESYLAHELSALSAVLDHFGQFKDEGILIRIEGKPVALSIFEHLNPETCVVHFEKALREYKGLYQLINRETARIIFSKGYVYINREEDLGIEGLRKTKLSYHPLELCPARALVFKK